MQFIAPKERFSTNARSLSIDAHILRAAMSKFGRSPDRTEFRRLPGGFMNANYVATVNAERFLVRVYSTDETTAERECDLLTFLASSDVFAPRVLARFQIGNSPVAILEFIEGITLEDRLLTDGLPLKVFHDIGTQLAKVHRITFPETGFIGPQLAIHREFDDFSRFLKTFIEDTLSMLLRRPDRLDPELNQRLARLVRDHWSLVMQTEPRRQLVHCDFNPKNLLVAADPSATLLAIIDWEFCLSGNGLGDLGNFFRFEYDYPTEARDTFIAGYRSVDAALPDNWFDVAKLIDVGSMCSFLSRPEDYQQSFRTARVVIQSTLQFFGY
jgi:aminoglycoside phosphotransferase (APT) family kinase protein